MIKTILALAVTAAAYLIASDASAEHHRDVNAAMNIAARGHARLAGGIPVL